MNVHFSEELQRFVRAQVQSGRYDSEDDVIRDVRDWLRECEQRPSVETGSSARPSRTVDEMISEMTSDVPEHEWDGLPTDGAEQHDHHIHGTPKRSR